MRLKPVWKVEYVWWSDAYSKLDFIERSMALERDEIPDGAVIRKDGNQLVYEMRYSWPTTFEAAFALMVRLKFLSPDDQEWVEEEYAGIAARNRGEEEGT